jgi:hypothetical protein
MSKIVRILKFSIILLIVALFTACAPSKKNTWVKKRKKASVVNTAQIGRNRFFYTPHYQKKLIKNYRRKR